MAVRIGIDVGGTNTDAAILRGHTVLAAAKAWTTPDVTIGISQAVNGALKAAAVSAADVSLVSLGTTSFLNAVIQRKGLAKVALLRLCGMSTTSLPPFCDLPADLCAAIEAQSKLLQGGFEYDGGHEISSLDKSQVYTAVQTFLEQGYRSFVISGVNSPVNPRHEECAGNIVEDAAKNFFLRRGAGVDAQAVYITLGHTIAQLGLLERENAATLNAAVQGMALSFVAAFQAALAEVGIKSAKLFFTSNDGTLLSADTAVKMPILLFQSGPVNSLRGAAFLSGVSDAIVLDIGGTTTDAGCLINGIARASPATASLAGVRTNFSMPDLYSIGLGGGSLVQKERRSRIKVGPISLGHQLSTRCLAVGGVEAATTDVAVILGHMAFGDREKAFAGLSSHDAQEAWDIIQQMIEGCIDAAKPSPADLPLIVVGGGAALCGKTIGGASIVLKPKFAEVANAVGAAIPQVSGSVDAVYKMGSAGELRTGVLQEVEAAAQAKAVAAGAIPESCQVVIKEEVPLAYLPGGVTRVHVRVMGDMVEAAESWEATCEDSNSGPVVWMDLPEGNGEAVHCTQPTEVEADKNISEANDTDCSSDGDPRSWQPEVNDLGEWLVSRRDLDALAIGCGLLGTGGGGSPYKARLKVLRVLDKGASIRVISPYALLPDALIGEAGFMGAPTVSIEKLDSNQAESALLALAAADIHKRQLAAVVASEIGGGNGIEPLLIAARLGLPVVDADYMGRAFPELQMMTTSIAGLPLAPAALTDEKGNAVVVTQCVDGAWLERILRPVCTAMGCSAGLATAPITGRGLVQMGILHSLSLAWNLGRALLAARFHKSDPITAVTAEGAGKLIFKGKVMDVQRSTSEGFAKGTSSLSGMATFQGQTLSIHFQNENLVASVDNVVVATVPDLIICMDTESGEPIQTEEMRYGLRLAVIGLPAHPLLCTKAALAVVGPSSFGYEVPYEPLGTYVQPMPVPQVIDRRR